MREVLKGREGLLFKSITAAIIFTAILYLLFAFSVVGISGQVTSPDTVSGLFEQLGGSLVFLISLFGLFAISTSYLMVSSAAIEIYNYDYRLSHRSSWLLAVIPPFILFLAGMRNFIDIIGMVGSVAIGLVGLIVRREPECQNIA